LICDGTAYDQTLYPDLFLAIGSTYNNASGQPSPAAGFFRVPDLRSRVPIGVGTGIGRVARTLASSGGQETRQIASANLPTHQHAIDHDHPNTTSTGDSVNHTHSGTTNNTNISHQHGIGFSGVGYVPGGSIMATPNSANPLTYPSVAADPVHAHSFGTGVQSTTHTHNTDIPNFVGTSGNGGFANTAIDIMNPTLGLNYIIKA
jgi:microcystin-dependent protein